MSRHNLPEGHRKIEFHEREFLKAVVDAAGLAEEWAYSPMVYAPSTGHIEFLFTCPAVALEQALNNFEHDPNWNDPEAGRFVELAEQPERTEEEERELDGLQRALLLKSLTRRE